MKKQKQKTEAGRKFVSLLLAVAMFFTLQGIPVLAETAGETAEKSVETAAVKTEEAVERTGETRELPSNPVHTCTMKDDGTDTTAWSYVYFGSYPQTEVTGDALTATITGASYDANGDAWVNGTKYRRMKKSDANHSYSGSGHFTWNGENDYHYFKWERIKWRVLNVNGSTMFVVADKGLDCKDYNEEYTSVTWETCTLRNWLNNDFYGTAFSSREQGAIVSQTVVNEDNPYYNTEGGNDTTDKVYLLSLSEVMDPDYGFCEDDDTDSVSRMVKLSDYAHARGACVNTGDNCWWWLRSPGYGTYYAAIVDYYGNVNSDGYPVNDYYGACVPALHINLSSDLWSMTDDGTSGEEGGSGTGDAGTQEFLQEHLDFANSTAYSEQMESRWAKVISKGLDTSTGKLGEDIYNVLNSASELVSCKSLRIFENPYDAIVAQLILEQTDVSLKDYNLSFKSELGTRLSYLEELCSVSRYSEEWTLHSSEYKTYLEKLIEDPASMKETNPAFYNLCSNIFQNVLDEKELEKWLNAYGKAKTLQSALNTYANVVNWVSDCVKFNSLVSAYISTSEEFKASLAAAEYFMEANVSEDNYLSRPVYSGMYTLAVQKYMNFLTEDRITELLLKEYTVNGAKRIADVFGNTVMKNTLLYISDGLGISKTAASWLYAAVEAYKTGWKISEAITDNGTNIECRELARASYYLEDAMAWMVENAADVLRKNKNLQAAKNFDSAYTILQNLESYALDNYIRYLDSQQKSFFPGILHGFRQYNMAEIEICKVMKLEWQNVCCHKEVSNRTDMTSVTTAKICCPTDISIYDESEQLVFCVENNKVVQEKRKITGSIVGGMKFIAIPDIEKYRIEIQATDDGTMSVFTDTYDVTDGGRINSSSYVNVAIKNDEVFTAEYEGHTILRKNGQIVESTGITGGNESKVQVSSIVVEGMPISMRTGESIMLSAKITPLNASCPVVSWASSDNRIATVDEYGNLLAKSRGMATISCSSIDGSGIIRTATIEVLEKNSGDGDATLTSAKEQSKGILETYKNPADYREAQQKELAAAIAAGKAAIDAAINEAGVSHALADAKSVIDQIKTNAQLTLEEKNSRDGSSGGSGNPTGNLKPGGTAIKGKIKATTKAFLVKWEKQTDITGYQIQYSTNKKFKKKGTKLKTVKKPQTTKLTVKKLKAGKKYYVRIRTCKIVNGTTYYSDWSKAKTVKIKK